MAVTLSAIFSFVLQSNSFSTQMIFPILGILFLALGSCSLNQIQEHKNDSLMKRTKNRVLPSQKMTIKKAQTITFLLLLLSIIFIYMALEYFGIIIFIAVIVIYNFIYTPLKKRSIYAGIYGSILGTIPPFIGWISSGGSILDLKFISIAILYLIWQVPHFWLLAIKYHQDYINGGFVSAVDKFGIKPLERITFIWIILTLLCGMFLIITFNVYKIPFLITLFFINFYTLYVSFNLLSSCEHTKIFITLNLYIVLTMSLITIDSFFKT